MSFLPPEIAFGRHQQRLGVTRRLLDALAVCTVVDRDAESPPAAPAPGEVWIVGPTPTGPWVTHAGELALWDGDAWAFCTAQRGWLVYLSDEDLYLKWQGSAWVAAFSDVVGATTFVALSDTPSTFSGQADRKVRVNHGETALEFVEDPAPPETFLALTDTPESFSGQAGKAVVVGSDGLQFLDFPSAPPTAALGTWLVSGGSIVWVEGLTFRVSAASYYLDGSPVSSAEQSLSLDAADETNDRIDVIVLDADGLVSSITGTPGAPPTESPVDPAVDLRLGIAYVAAGATAPELSAETVYAENTEWPGTASAGSIVANSTSTPRSGSLAIEGTAVAAGTYVNLTRASGSVDLAAYAHVVLYVRVKAAWPAKKALRLSWYASGVLQGAQVTVGHGAFGLNTQTVGSYQQVVVPLRQFAVPAGSAIDRLRLEVVGSGGSVGWFIDDVSLQGDVTTPPAATDVSFLQLTDAPDSFAGQALRDLRVNSGASALEFYASPYDVPISVAGTPEAEAELARLLIPRAVTFPSGLSGSYGYGQTAPSAQTDVDVRRADADGANEASVGTVRFAEGAQQASFIAASPIALTAGQQLILKAPAALNGLAGLSVTLVGTR